MKRALLVSSIPLKSFLLALLGLFFLHRQSEASIIFLYDFPNDPGSGLAVDQANPQPTFATMSNFTRTNVTLGGGPNFNSTNWSAGAQDTTEYVGFSIAASSWYYLNLTDITFDVKRQSGGPLNGQVAIFLNGSATPYATQNFSTTTSFVSSTFDFTDLTNADAITSATVLFYAWNAGGGGLILDNVGIDGLVAAVPEITPAWFMAIFIVACVGFEMIMRRWRRGTSGTG